MFLPIKEAHQKLVNAVQSMAKPGFSPIPITLVSVNSSIEGQLVAFDGNKFSAADVAARLRLAADFIESQIPT